MIIVNVPQKKPKPTAQQLRCYASKNKILCDFPESHSVQMMFNNLVFSVKNMSEIELYNEIMRVE